MGHPVVRRFRIRRHPRDFMPWTLTDRARPAYIQHFHAHADAVAAMNAKLRQEEPMRFLGHSLFGEEATA